MFCLTSTVGEAPNLLEDLSDLTSNAPDKVTLQCTVNLGDPKGTITWYKDDKKLKTSKRVEPSYLGNVASCVISQSEFSDAGWYRIEVENKLGRVQSQCQLTVYSKFSTLSVCWLY